jgi:site-specific DNA-methyltransferase (adenine-specific)
MKFINQIIHGDCLEIMKGIPDGVIDMVLCDLPYGTTACKWDVIIPFAPLWEQYERIIKHDGAIVLTSAQPFTSILITSNIKLFRYSWVWDKAKATNFMSAKLMPLLKTEDICVFSKATCNSMSKTKMKYFPQGIIKIDKEVTNGKNVGGKVAQDRHAVFAEGKEYIQEYTNFPKNILEIPNDANPLHPTQKPLALFEYLIRTYSEEEDKILDNCIGSGTTAEACINTNRRFIGIEKELKYVEIARERINGSTISLRS